MAQTEKTAVQWLIERYPRLITILNKEIIEKARLIELNQMLMAYNSKNDLPFDKWYNQTFNNKK